MIHVFHHATHVFLAHPVHAHAILIAPLGCPIVFNTGVFRALTILFSDLVGLLHRRNFAAIKKRGPLSERILCALARAQPHDG